MVRWEIPPYTRGRVLQIGGRLFPHFMMVTDDPNRKSETGNLFCSDVTSLPFFANQSFDAVVAKEPLAEYWRLVRPGGHLVVYGKDEPPEGIWDLVLKQEHDSAPLRIWKKLTQGKSRESWDKPKPEKSVLVCRMGAFGDLLQASSAWAGLKKQGYHVTLMSTPPGVDVVTHDPNIDAFYLLDRDQIPNQNLSEFWAYAAKKYDKFVNLSESVEGTLLALNGRAPYEWPTNVRHAVMNRNYLEFQHLLAGVPHEPAVRFYPTDEERAWARKERAKCGGPVVMWSLAGSSVHKHHAALDQIVARLLLTFGNATVVLAGGPECQVLEYGWEAERRVKRVSGKWSIRETLTFAEECDLVIGPETGVLNSVSHRPVPKVLFLSHSSHENLSRDWTNCIALAADSKRVGCYPCHKLVTGWNQCWKNEETGMAQCQADISADKIWEAVMTQLQTRAAA